MSRLHPSRRTFLRSAPIAVLAFGASATRIAAETQVVASHPDIPDAQKDETAGLVGLPLAAIHLERAAAAMAHPDVLGKWTVTVHSGDADRHILFHQDIAKGAAIRRAIDAHRTARAALNDCCDASDEMSANYGGPAAVAVWERRCDEEELALAKLLRLPVSGEANAVRAAYLAELHSSGALDCGHFEALLRSMAEVL